ncbi:MAG: SUMF1/EgtB/PvdO family nonheme iron enzyme [Planctomycetes bacterium]|nr:SUMF1/EgtB/PvdO family nonheme iron enzyme [Planctomycetota bacterium]
MSDQADRSPSDAEDEALAQWLDRLTEASTEKGFDLDVFLEQVPTELRDGVRRLAQEVAWVKRLVATAVEDPSLRVAPGTRVGDYEVVRELGRGSMGVVYLARQISLQRLVALKFLQPQCAISVYQIERFRREAKSAARLRHPGIVPIHAMGEAHGVRFFAMEYVPGRTLHEELQGLRKSHASGDAPSLGDPLGARADRPYVEQAAWITAKLADALDHAHQHGVIHRDVKPHNVLISEEGEPMLVDFGLAKDLVDQSLSKSGEIAGTPCYMSPEQALAERDRIDRRTDVFSLGVVLYEMLTLKRPFEGESSHEVFRRIVDFDPPALELQNHTVPRDLAVICRKAMEKRREDRYSSAAEFAADLRRFLAGESILARPPSLAQRTQRWVRRNRVLAASIAAGVLALSLGVIGSKVRAGYTERDAWPRIVLSVTPGVEVFVRRVDPRSGKIGEREIIGQAPLDPFTLEPGVWRIVAVGDGAFAEMTRTLDLHEVIELAPRLVPTVATRVDMSFVPEADFIFGEETNKRVGPRSVQHAPAVWLDDTEVTNRSYHEFVVDTHHAPPELWFGGYDPALDEYPVVGVAREDAQAFAEWAGKRLPTEFEWEHASRGEDGRLYPWGNDPGLLATAARFDGVRSSTVARTQLEQYRGHVEPVRSRPEGRSPYGHLRMLDNVHEFTESTFIEHDGDQIIVRSRHAVVMGASFADASGERHLSFRADMHPGVSDPVVGFRCAKSAAP